MKLHPGGRLGRNALRGVTWSAGGNTLGPIIQAEAWPQCWRRQVMNARNIDLDES